MTADIKELERRLERRAAPLFARQDPAAEKVPKGFVGNEETAELRDKLRELLAPADLQTNQNAGTIANECDRRAAERLIKEDRRFTKAEAQFVNDLYGSWETWKGKISPQICPPRFLRNPARGRAMPETDAGASKA